MLKIIVILISLKNTESIVFENGGFVGNLGLVKKTMEEIY